MSAAHATMPSGRIGSALIVRKLLTISRKTRSFCQPDIINEVKGLNALEQHTRDDQSDPGFGGALIIAELGEPAIDPIFGAPGFPEDDAAMLSSQTQHAVQDIAAELALL